MRPALSTSALVAAVATVMGATACASKEPPAPPPERVAEPAASAAAVEAPAPEVKAEAPASDTQAANAQDDAPRVYAKSRYVWVHSEPGAAGWIGFLWFGGSVKLKSSEPVMGGGCTKWVAIEPRGFVCADGVRATTDPNDPQLVALRKYAPRVDTPWPHDYGESRGLQRYTELPTPEQQRKREWDLAAHLERVAAAAEGGERHASLEGVDLTPGPNAPIDLGTFPATVRENRTRLLPASTVAWAAETRFGDRSFLLSADWLWVPKDRVMVYPKVTFKGLHLGKDAELPLAFFRGKDRDKWLRSENGVFTSSGEKFARLSHVGLTGKSEEHDGKTYLETKDGKHWVEKGDAVVPTLAQKTPWGAPVGGEDTAQAPPGRRTWMAASIWGGWLIAYEGTKPVFVTMISPGRGGTPVRGKDPLETASTPTGTFKITGKFKTATMVAPGDFIHSDVPWAMNFSGPHALHGAYWHDDWGNRKSAGCVNLSPIDGKFLFEWTEPPALEGWHGVRWRATVEPATTFVVHD